MSVALVLGLALAPQPPTEPPRLQAARTWGHLRAVEPIAWNGDDGRRREARLAVERTRAAEGESVLVYGLFQGGDEPWIGLDALGPLVVVPLCDATRSADIEIELHRVAVAPASSALYVLAVPLLPGVRGIEVHSAEGTVLARSEWTIAGSAHPWMPLDPAPDRPEANERDDHLEVHLAARSRGSAIPRWDGRAPLSEALEVDGNPVRRADDEPLPTSRLQHDGRLVLRIDRLTPGALVLETSVRLPMSPPHRYLLFRFWIDGKPFVPPRAVEPVRSWSDRSLHADRVHLHLHVEPEDLGAAPDATIAVQVLYAPAGWCWLAPSGTPSDPPLPESVHDPQPAITQMEILPRQRP